MLSRPKAGWSELTLGDFKAPVSFLTDIPFDWVRACLSSLKYGIPAAFFLDSEGTTTTIVVNFATTYIISSSDLSVTYMSDIFVTDFAKMLIEDIRRDFDDWLYWLDASLTEEKWANRRKMLEDLLAETEKACEEFSKLDGMNY